jgi:hypothetical protein
MMTPGGVRSAAMGLTFRRRQSAPRLRRTPSARQARLPASGAARPTARGAIPRGGLSPGAWKASCSPHAGNCCGGPPRLRGSLTTARLHPDRSRRQRGRRGDRVHPVAAARRAGRAVRPGDIRISAAWRYLGHTRAAEPASLREYPLAERLPAAGQRGCLRAGSRACPPLLLCRWLREVTGRYRGMVRRRVRAERQRSLGIRLR